MHAEGVSLAAIADHLGVTRGTVRDLALKHFGLRFARPKAKKPVVEAVVRRHKRASRQDGAMGRARAAILLRQQHVLALHNSGAAVTDIMAQLRMARVTVYRDLNNAVLAAQALQVAA